MRTLYADESIAPALRFTIVAGYVADDRRWQQFEINWKLILAHYNVPYFHVASLSHWRGPYDTWKGND